MIESNQGPATTTLAQPELLRFLVCPRDKQGLSQRGNALIQMSNVFGIRCLYHQFCRGFREARDFEVRYWKPAELLSAFTSRIGDAHLSVDGFFSLNVQSTDMHLFPARYRALVLASEALRCMGQQVPVLVRLADSLYVSARRAN